MPFRAEQGVLRGRVDWGMIVAVAGLVAAGSLAILSAASPLPMYGAILQKHFLAMGIGVALFVFGLGFNYQVYQDQSKVLYGLAVAMMVLVLGIGQVARGTKGWIHLGLFSFQPSELARIMSILVLANYLDRNASRAGTLRYALTAIAIVAPVMGLVLIEPDFSGAIPFFPIALGMLFCAGASVVPLLAMGVCGLMTFGLVDLWTLMSIRPEWTANSVILTFLYQIQDFNLSLVAAIVGICVATFAAWKLAAALRLNVHGLFFAAAGVILTVGLCMAIVFNHQLKGYQRDRFVAFLMPESNVQGAAYNVRQAQIAIGSGGLWGKGVFSGTQSRLGFVPERHTDFIYAVIGEEMGFLGAMFVLAMYLLLLWRIVHTARLSRDRYGYLVCCGMAATYGFYLVANVGMCLGMMPVIGIPLPLVSYGGSSLAIALFSLGIVANIYSRRYAFY